MAINLMERFHILAAAGIVAALCFLSKLCLVRLRIQRLRRQGLPMPPHSWLTGHLFFVAGILKALPPKAHANYVADQVRKKCPHLNEAFYLDLWPFAPSMLVLITPDLIHQITQVNQLPKHAVLRNFLRPLTGKEDLLSMEGAKWKRLRAVFSPGFSAKQITSLAPGIVEKVEVLCQKLHRHAVSREIFRLEECTLTLTMDVIGGAVLDHDFRSQTTENTMVNALRSQLQWCTTGSEMDPLDYLLIHRPLVHTFNTWKMNRYLRRELKHRYNCESASPKMGGKSILDLASRAYSDPSSEMGHRSFQEAALTQIKLFLFAGHDTTSTATVFTLHLLSQHPEVRDDVRKEHAQILGEDPSATLKASPHLLYHLPLTLAVIKETLRLYPAVDALREGQPNFNLTGSDGKIYPTVSFLIWGDHYGTHCNPDIWPHPYEFLPERWLVEADHALYPPPNAWRPFERGPRTCIGQELALAEIKVVLALVLNKFDVQDAYEENDARIGNPGRLGVNGQRAYMVRTGGAGHPADGYPCRVTIRNS